MSSFTVSARKYRPGIFDSVIGQAHVTQTLKNAIRKDHLGHAFLFCGPRGVGKTTCARILAKSLNCDSPVDGEPCGECAACQSFQNHQSFNIYELDAASNNSVEDIRSLNDQVRFAPQSGKYKIYIIDEVHMLSQAAFNAFLKTLEEPPSYAIFILATTEKHKIIPTILSRCQVFDFHRISVKECIQHLKSICVQENIEADEEALTVIAQKADGALRDALSIFDRVVSYSGNRILYQDVIHNLNVLDYEYYFKVIDYFLSGDLATVMLIFDDILNKGFDSHNFLNGLSEHIRNLIVCKDPSTIKLLDLSEGTQKLYIEQSKNTSLSFLLSALNILNQFDVNFKTSKNQRLHVELALMKLCHIPDAIKFVSEGKPISEKKNPDNLKQVQELVNTPGVVMESEPEPVEPASPRPLNFKIEEARSVRNVDPLENIRKKVVQERHEKKRISEEVLTETEVFVKTEIDIFKTIWTGYIQDLKVRKKDSMASIAEEIQPVINESGEVEIDLTNDALRKQFEDDRLAFSNYLNKNHQADMIKINFRVVELSDEDQKKYLVTDTDKFKRMIELNPAVLDLQKRLGLRVI